MSIQTHSRPSELKITDLRFAIVGHDNWRWPLLRIYTNQGITGLGEVRDGASVRQFSRSPDQFDARFG